MAEAPPPRASPQPPGESFGPETVTGVHRALRHDLNWQGAKLTIAMVVVAVSTAFAAYRFILGEALAQTDAGMRVVGEVSKALDARITTLEKRFDRYDAKVDRQTEQLELALDALHVPQRVRPEPLPPLADAGVKK